MVTYEHPCAGPAHPGFLIAADSTTDVVADSTTDVADQASSTKRPMSSTKHRNGSHADAKLAVVALCPAVCRRWRVRWCVFRAGLGKR
jgi:hypothetical protein